MQISELKTKVLKRITLYFELLTDVTVLKRSLEAENEEELKALLVIDRVLRKLNSSSTKADLKKRIEERQEPLGSVISHAALLFLKENLFAGGTTSPSDQIVYPIEAAAAQLGCSLHTLARDIRQKQIAADLYISLSQIETIKAIQEQTQPASGQEAFLIRLFEGEKGNFSFFDSRWGYIPMQYQIISRLLVHHLKESTLLECFRHWRGTTHLEAVLIADYYMGLNPTIQQQIDLVSLLYHPESVKDTLIRYLALSLLEHAKIKAGVALEQLTKDDLLYPIPFAAMRLSINADDLYRAILDEKIEAVLAISHPRLLDAARQNSNLRRLICCF
jgi:hypothetical protein